jgi:hypothetical protein
LLAHIGTQPIIGGVICGTIFWRSGEADA